MNISLEYGTEDIYWKALCEVFRLAPLGIREPEKPGMGLFPNPEMSRAKGYLD